MQKSILEQLFNGELHPAEQCAPKSEEYKKALLGYREIKKKLVKTFDGKQHAMSETLCECYYKIVGMENAAIFAEGFKLGARMMLETLADSKYRR